MKELPLKEHFVSVWTYTYIKIEFIFLSHWCQTVSSNCSLQYYIIITLFLLLWLSSFFQRFCDYLISSAHSVPQCKLLGMLGVFGGFPCSVLVCLEDQHSDWKGQDVPSNVPSQWTNRKEVVFDPRINSWPQLCLNYAEVLSCSKIPFCFSLKLRICLCTSVFHC